MNNRRLILIRQIHRIYGDQADAILTGRSHSPVYSRTCHLNQIQNLRKQW